MTEEKVLYKTGSVCPVCLKRVPAERISRDGEIFLKKTCSEHGTFESIIWRGHYDMAEWVDKADSPYTDSLKCPDGCGLCPDHLNKTCCVILNVTDRCNLNCNFCFADPDQGKEDPSLEKISESLYKLINKGKSLVQLSGGEPTVRKDITQIVRIAKRAGAKYVQLNTNGVLLGKNKQFVKELAEAGLSFVFMQFDGTEDGIYEKLRNEPLLKIKQQTIENCSEYNIGVTLVPTLVRDININNTGEIIRYALSQVPKVRGVHFQPVSYFGRIPEIPSDRDRITIDELLYEIERQTEGTIKAKNLLPSSCYHPLCSFHGSFIIHDQNVIPLLGFQRDEKESCCDTHPADKNREFVGRHWLRPSPENSNTGSSCCGGNIQDMDYFLSRARDHGFTITSMLFQDAGNLDFSRLRKCSLHVYDNDRFVPFCAYYLTGWKK